MTKATNNVARVAAAVAGLGLVAMSFAPAVGAQTSTSTSSSTSSSVTFSRDLTVGATGADVSALQTWLIGKGFSIPAGATGYFGSQTKAAVAAYQAANHITPAAGYFGPITRASVASMGGVSTGGSSSVPGCMPGYAFSSTTGAPCGSSTGSTSGLSGGEATLSNFDLLSGDNLQQGDTNKEIAVAKFDVKNGDVNVQRVTVALQPTSSSYNQHPWSYFQTLSVYDGSKKVGSVDVSSKSDWSQTTGAGNLTGGGSLDSYSVDIPVNDIIRQGNNNELSIHADAQSTIDTANNNQTFDLWVPLNGIRAVDAAGIQEYAGSNSGPVVVGFNAAQNGKLNITTSSNNPGAGVLVADTTNTSDSYDVLTFDIRNSQDASAALDSMTFRVATTSASGSPAKDISSIIRRATLTLDGDTYTGTIAGTAGTSTIVFDNLNTSVSGNSSISGTLSVELYGQTGHFAATGESLTFSLANADVTAESSDTGDSSTVTGSATGKTQTVGTNAGISVSAGTNSATEAYNSTTPSNSTGSFALSFKVTANGTQDVYIPKTIVAEASTSKDTTHGVAVADDLGASTVGTTSASVSSSAATDPDNSAYYVVHAGSSETFTANVTMDPSAAGYYQIGLNEVNFTTVSTGGSLQNLDLNPNDYSSAQLYIHG